MKTLKIYIIKDINDKVIYIGKTTQSGFFRLTQHCSPCNYYKSSINTYLQNNKENVDWFYSEFEVKNKWMLFRTERKLIQKYNPKYNKQLIIKTKKKVV